MDYQTAASISNNLAGIGQMFMQARDPETQAKAALARAHNTLLGAQVTGQNLENQYKPGIYKAQTDNYNASAADARAGAGLKVAETEYQNGRTRAQNELLQSTQNTGGVPTTSFSTGAAVGGPDEMQDSWTNKGYTATGQNLRPGVVAVNPSRYPLGTVFDGGNGNIYIAADRHGNKDPNVVDIFQSPDAYKPQNSAQNLKVIGHEPIPYGTTGEQLDAIRAKYAASSGAGASPQPQQLSEQQRLAVRQQELQRLATLQSISSNSSPDSLLNAIATGYGLSANTEQEARRALAAKGQLANQGEYFEPKLSDAYQQQELQARYATELDKTGAGNEMKARLAVFNAGVGGGTGKAGGKVDPYAGAKEISAAVLPRFSVDGQTITPENQPIAGDWAASVNLLTSRGVPFNIAKSVADSYHGLPSVNNPFIGKSTLDTSRVKRGVITPEQADNIAKKYGVGGGRPGQIANAAQIFGYGNNPSQQVQPDQIGQTEQTAPSGNTPIPLSIARPPDSGPPKASDEFKPKEGRKERAALEDKQTKIATLKGQIDDLASQLRSGKANIPSRVTGGMTGAFYPPSVIDNDSHNAMLEELKMKEAELSQLTAPSTSAATPQLSIEDRLSKYR